MLRKLFLYALVETLLIIFIISLQFFFGLIGGDKVSAVRACSADAVATPNPGCMMQSGAGLRLEASNEGVIHPVELLDESYRRAGFYRAGGAE